MSDTPDFLTQLPGRAVIAITGPDARSFLERVISNGPAPEPGRAQFSSLLTPQGKVLADFIVFDDGEGGLLIDAPESEAEALARRLTMYKLRSNAEIALREDVAVIAAAGPREAELDAIAIAAAPDPRARALGRRAIASAGGPEDETGAYHAARIAAGVPEFGADYAANAVFSTDVNHDLMGGVDYKKGCFVGQEVASRMRRKGGVRKRTVRLSLDGPVEPGAPVTAGETPLGEVTSFAADAALARLRTDRARSALDAGETIITGGVEARVLDDPETLAATV